MEWTNWRFINQHIDAARKALDTLHQRKEAANQKLLQLRNQMADAYRRLARFRLDELAANRMVTLLDETDRAVVKLLDRRQRPCRRWMPTIEQAASRIDIIELRTRAGDSKTRCID